jgi:hypothetical protein
MPSIFNRPSPVGRGWGGDHSLPMTKKFILYLATHGFAARMILQTGLVHQLVVKGHRVGIIVPDAKDENLVNSCRESGVELIEIPGHLPALQAQLMQFRRYFLDDIEANPALLEKHMQREKDPARKGLRRLQTRLGWGTYRLTKGLPFLRSLYKKVEPYLLKSSSVRQGLEALRPDLVIATYPVFPPEFHVLAAAKDLGIHSAIHLLSWDNITSKGAFPALADDYIAWGPIMDQELQDFYGIDQDQIHQCGVPHFDLHVRSKEKPDVKPHVAELGLDPNKPYLFHAMSAPRFSPKEIDVVEWIADRVEEGRFGPDMQFVIRPHPQNMTGYMADFSWVDRLKALAGRDRIAVNYPGLVQDSKLPWSMRENDMVVFSQLIGGSSVVLNIGSTVSIDALMTGKPVILTSFDADEELPYWQSARRLIDFTHLEKFVAEGGISVTRNFTELETEIDAYINDPEHNLKLRQKTLEAECFQPDGKATQRVVEAIEKLLLQT